MTVASQAQRRRRLPPQLTDALLVVLLILLTVGGSIGESYPIQHSDRVVQGHLTPAAPWSAYLLVGVAALVLGWRRRYPLAVLAVSVATVVGYTSLGYVNGAALLAPAVALYTIALAAPARHTLLAGLVTLVALGTVTAIANPLGTFGGTFTVLPVLMAAAVFAGLAIANRRAYIGALAARAELAERTKEDDARRAVDAERLRIARELHDVVAHTMATINVQAGAASHVTAGLPEQADTALRAIKTASKRGLGELRAILAVLRQADEAEATQPLPGLAALDTLVDTVSAAGLPTVVRTTGTVRALSVTVDLAAYRIIQESLTNCIRHAAPATATVALHFHDDQLCIDVTDTGPGPDTTATGDGSGHGLRGMTERATAIGGTLTTGPATHGGFRVLAQLPTGAP